MSTLIISFFARNVGFDWEERSQVWTKVKEEIGEFEAEVENMDKEKAVNEFAKLPGGDRSYQI